MLSAGSRQADGSWSLTASQLGGLALRAPANFSGSISLTLRATATDHDGSTAVSTAPFSVTVGAVADAVRITGAGRGAEDSWITLRGTVALLDTDGSETVNTTLVVSGVPTGAVLSTGTEISSGVWQVPRSAYENGTLALRPPANSDADIRLTIAATTTDSGGGVTSQQTTAVPVTILVRAVADAPTVMVADAHGSEDGVIRLAGLGGALTDTDGSESLSFSIAGLPHGASLTQGTPQRDGSWTLTPAQLAAVSFNPPANFSGTIALTLTAISTERNNGAPSARTSAGFTISVDPVVDAGTITGNAAGHEDSIIRLTPEFATPDADGSESWSAISRISGVPAGAVLTEGTEVSPGIWEVSTVNLRNGVVGVRPPANSDADFSLTISATLTDTGNGTSVTRTVTATSMVTVQAVADAPVVTAADVVGAEDSAIPLTLSAALADTDGSEGLHVSLLGVPAAATLSRGTRASDGSWTLSLADLPGLTLTPPKDFSGPITLTLRATASDHDGSSAVTDAAFTVQVTGVADTPDIRSGAGIGLEDTAIAIKVAGTTTDTDGSESIVAYRLLDLPAGAVLQAGGVALARQADGSVLVDSSMAASLTVTPPANSDTDFTLRVTAISAEPIGSRAESAPVDLRVWVVAAADAPVWQNTVAHGTEDTPILLDLAAQLVDTDGSETLYFLVSGLPAGASLNAGSFRGNGTWSLTATEAASVGLVPPRDFAGTIALTVTAVSQEVNGGSQAAASVSYTVQVGAVVDTPAVGGLDGTTGRWNTASGVEDQPIALNLDPGLADRDGSETLVGDIVIGNVPAGAVLRLADGTIVTAGADGFHRIDAAQRSGVTLTMPANSDVAATLTLRMTIEDTGGVRHDIGGTLVVDPTGDADMPALTLPASTGSGHTSTRPDTGWVSLQIGAATPDADGSEALHVWVRDVPAGASLSAGTPAGNGLWLVPTASLAALAIRPPAGYAGDITLRVSAVTTEREGDEAVRTNSVTITVTAAGSGSGLTSGSGSGPDIDLMTSPSTAPAPTWGTAGVTRTASASTLKGTDDNDTLYGRASRDQLIGDDGDDTLYGYGSNTGVRDQLVGDGGNDTFVFGSSAELASTVVNAGSDDDTVRLLGSFNTVDDSMFVAPAVSGGGVVRLVTSAERLELLGTGMVSVSIGTNFEHSFGNAAIEALQSSAFKLNAAGYNKELTILSGAGNDTIITGDDEDHIDGGAGDDIIVAGAKDDTIIGGAGSDKIDGGADDDRLVYRGNRADYVVTALTGDPDGYQFSVASKSGAVDKIKNIEYLDFADVSGKTPASLAAQPAPRAPAAQAPHLHVVDAAVMEDSSVALAISVAGADADGGRETLGLRIDGVPPGANLSAGVHDPVTGAWVLRPDELAGLRLSPVGNFAGTIMLTVNAIAAEATGDLASTTATLRIEVDAVADAATIRAAPGDGVEDTAIPLNLTIMPGDGDGSESVVAVQLSGLSPGSRIAPGTGITDNGDGTWSVAPAHLGDVRLLPPAHAHGSLTVTVTAMVREVSNGNMRSSSRDITVEVAASPDTPDVTAGDVTGAEDSPIALQIGAALVDQDGSEVLSIVLSGMPSGTRLSTGVNNGDGSWTLRPEQLAGLTLIPPNNWSGDMALRATAYALERSTGASASTHIDFHVHVDGVADAPLVTAAPTARGTEDSAVSIDIGTQFVDDDGSESIEVIVTNVPAGGHFSSGTANSDGSWTIPGAALPGLTFTPPENFSGTQRLDLAISSVDADGNRRSVPVSVTLTVTPVTDAPMLTLGTAQGDEDTVIPLSIAAALTDTDGSEQLLRLEITGVPAGAGLSAGTHNADGSWTLLPGQLAGLALSPPANYAGTLQLSVTAVAVETATGIEASTTATLDVQLQPVTDAPVLTFGAAQGDEDTAIPLPITAALTDTDGSEQLLRLEVTGVPAGASLSAGTHNTDGSWTLLPGQLAGLALTPPANHVGPLHLSVTAVAVETATGIEASTTATLDVQVQAVNDAPTLVLASAPAAAVGAPEAAALGAAAAADGDSAHLGSATVTLAGGASGDQLVIGGFSLAVIDGKTMVGSTGIEVVGGGYDSATGSLTLRGDASPATYSAVLQGLVLENAGGAGLATGTRTIGVVLHDDLGAVSVQQTVGLVVQPSVLAGNGHDQSLAGTAGPDSFIGSAGSETMQGGAGADIFILTAGGGHDVIDGGGGSWVDAIEVRGAGAPDSGSWTMVVDTAQATATPSANAINFDQPVSGHIQFADGTHAEFSHIERVTW
ncbi:Ig-like domain-containing protein [Belnapia moabensis]|uniref:Ig-like domain-containing protein n=1 Tax=Belnapia moabensis TaxID=365533 RepID=UPI000A8D5107|nr:Ig-like domain-containing protein [Belnapia moabensis]